MKGLDTSHSKPWTDCPRFVQPDWYRKREYINYIWNIRLYKSSYIYECVCIIICLYTYVIFLINAHTQTCLSYARLVPFVLNRDLYSNQATLSHLHACDWSVCRSSILIGRTVRAVLWLARLSVCTGAGGTFSPSSRVVRHKATLYLFTSLI